MIRAAAALSTALLFLVSSATASDVAVVVDVSGSMASYGNWQPDALSLVEAILSGNSTSGLNFKYTGDLNAASDFKLGSNGSIQLLKFGSTQSNSFPFFREPERLPDVSELQSRFPLYRREFSQAHTNKDLAIAVASRVAGGAPAHLVMISDFLIDSDVNQSQQQYVNDFQSSSKIETPLIFAWQTDPRIQVKLMLTTAKDSAPPSPAAPPAPEKATAAVRITEGRASTDSNRIYFRWQVEPNVPVRSYTLSLRDAKTGRIAKQEGPLAAVSSSSIEAPRSGQYTAIVRADFEDGTEAESLPFGVTVKGRNSGVFFVLLALAVIIGGVWYASVRGRRRHLDHPNYVKEDDD